MPPEDELDTTLEDSQVTDPAPDDDDAWNGFFTQSDPDNVATKTELDQLRAEVERLRASQYTPPTTPPTNSAQEGRQMSSLELQMLKEVDEIHPDAPPELRQQVARALQGYDTYAAMLDAYNNKAHMSAADLASGHLSRTAGYIPPSIRQNIQRTAPAQTERPAPPIRLSPEADRTARDMIAYAKGMGYDLDYARIAKGATEEARRSAAGF